MLLNTEFIISKVLLIIALLIVKVLVDITLLFNKDQSQIQMCCLHGTEMCSSRVE